MVQQINKVTGLPLWVTADDVAVGRLLAEAVGQYVAELERRMSAGREDGAAGGDGAGAGGVMASPMWAGRLELVPPAAPGFSPPGKEEVTRVCAR